MAQLEVRGVRRERRRESLERGVRREFERGQREGPSSSCQMSSSVCTASLAPEQTAASGCTPTCGQNSSVIILRGATRNQRACSGSVPAACWQAQGGGQCAHPTEPVGPDCPSNRRPVASLTCPDAHSPSTNTASVDPQAHTVTLSPSNRFALGGAGWGVREQGAYLVANALLVLHRQRRGEEQSHGVHGQRAADLRREDAVVPGVPHCTRRHVSGHASIEISGAGPSCGTGGNQSTAPSSTQGQVGGSSLRTCGSAGNEANVVTGLVFVVVALEVLLDHHHQLARRRTRCVVGDLDRQTRCQ